MTKPQRFALAAAVLLGGAAVIAAGTGSVPFASDAAQAVMIVAPTTAPPATEPAAVVADTIPETSPDTSAETSADTSRVTSADTSADTTPAMTPTVRVSKGASAVGQPGCTSEACAYLDVELTGFAPGSVVTLSCRAGDTIFASHTVTVDGEGGHRESSCYFGYPGASVAVDVDGVFSEALAW